MGGSSSSHEVPLDLPQQEVVSIGHAPFAGAASGAYVRPPPSARHETTEQVKVQLVWDKGSFSLQRCGAARHLWRLSGTFTAEVPCELSVHFQCREQAGPHLLEYRAADPAAPPSFAQSFPAGRHTVALDGDRAIDLKRWPYEHFWRYRQSAADVLPVVFSLCAPKFQSVVHLALEAPPARRGSSGSDGSELKCTLIRQKVFVAGQEYVLQEMYGLADLGKDSAHADSAAGEQGSTCVICLTDPRNTAILPCRHMCICQDCAQHLRHGVATRNDHCPICRGNIEGLQVFDLKK